MIPIKKISHYTQNKLLLFSMISLFFLVACSEVEKAETVGQSGNLCSDDSQCNSNSTCYNGRCTTKGIPRFSLFWTEDTDFDLHVLTPGGTEIYYENPIGDGGTLDYDDCVQSNCADQNGIHVENIYFASSAALGIYTYWVYNFTGTTSGTFTIEVFDGVNKVATQNDTLPGSHVDSSKYTYSNSE